MIGGSVTIVPARWVRGRLRVPGDKSISHRYAMLAGIARGATTIDGLAPGADVAATLACLEALGVGVARNGGAAIRVTGRPGLMPPATALYAANSGTTMRLLAGLLAGCPFPATITGDASLSRRPMGRVAEPLAAMGARVTTSGGRPPLQIAGGGLHGIRWRPPVASAQIKSAILFAGLAADGRTTVDEPAPTRDHTERALPLFGLRSDTDGWSVSVEGGQRAEAPASALSVPGDASSAAVWAAAAAALPGSAVSIDGVGLNPRRLGFVNVIRRLGATVSVEPAGESGGEPVGTLSVAHGERRAVVIEPAEVPDLIDELPVLAAAAALGAGLEVSGAAELRVKESDRIAALVAGLRALGVNADERPDGFVVAGGRRPAGGTVDASGDHRLVMAFTLVGLGASGPTTITGADVVTVSYPGFTEQLERLRT